SWGGALVRLFAALQPDDVARLVYLDAMDWDATPEDYRGPFTAAGGSEGGDQSCAGHAGAGDERAGRSARRARGGVRAVRPPLGPSGRRLRCAPAARGAGRGGDRRGQGWRPAAGPVPARLGGPAGVRGRGPRDADSAP